MSRLIDADRMEMELTASDIDLYVRECLNEQPTVDAVEVVHGEWKSGICTNCGYHRPYVGRDYYNVQWNYCPNCGAKMDGEEVK